MSKLLYSDFLDNYNDFIVLQNYYALSFIPEPGKKFYYLNIENDKLRCTEKKMCARFFDSRDTCLVHLDMIKNKFDLDFSVERL